MKSQKKIDDLVDITCVGAGNYHSLCCDTNGKVWSFGKNSLGCLGSLEDDRPYPMLIEGLENIIFVTCGDIHSACIDGNSFAWTFGDNRDWKLGLPEKKIYLPTRVDLPDVRAVACGGDHTLFLTTTGKVYSTGANRYGQLGTEEIKDRDTPTLQCIPNIPNIKCIAAATWYSSILTSQGEVYSFGFNTNGMLGVGDTAHRNTPTKVDFPEGVEIRHVACGYYHTMFVDSMDNLWVTGRNTDGQLGLGDNDDRHAPVKFENKAVKSVCYLSYGGCQTIMKDSDTVIWAFGDNNHGQLGLGYKKRENSPVALDENLSSIIGQRSIAKSARKVVVE